MRKKGNSRNSVILVVLAAAVLAAASIFFLIRQYEVEVDNAQGQLLAKGRTTLDALAAGIRAQSRRGMYRADRLAAIFDELAQTPGILALQLRSESGAIVASGGELEKVPALPPRIEQWEPDKLLMTISADFAHPRPGDGRRRGGRGEGGRGLGLGRGPGRGLRGGYGIDEPELGDTAWEEGPHILTVALHTGDLLMAIRNARLQLAGGAIVVLLAISSGAWAFVSQLHQRRMATDLLLAEERVAQSERLARLGAGLAHETKNPLGVVRGLAQSILDVPDTKRQIRNMAQQIVDESDRTVGQINSFLGFARPLEPDLHLVNLTSLLDEMKPLFEAEARGNDIAISCEGNDLTVRADETMLRRALMNLVINGIRAVKPRGSVAVRAERIHHQVRIMVEDTGCGIAPEDMGRLTDPYFGRFEGGSGLGLAIVDQIARAHGWRLTFHSVPGSNTQVSLEGLSEV
ncbi:MAG: ATP-binding protein, partial [Candidatus Hydrogenedentes bacterium]|nr:ATP-binding protein [Candidatus Hydrogenedentota bacterium]